MAANEFVVAVLLELYSEFVGVRHSCDMQMSHFLFGPTSPGSPRACAALSRSLLSLVAGSVGVFLLHCSPPVTPSTDASTDGAVNESGVSDVVVSPPMDGESVVDVVVSPPADVPDYDVVLPPATPITAPNETWTWIDFPEALCGNGAATGIAVNLTNRSRKVFVYMMGGGACWNASTCYDLGTAANIATGYTDISFRRDLTAFDRVGIFSRDDLQNPFRDASFVFIPYCTGDTHGGNRVQVYDPENFPNRRTYHVGGRNVDFFLRRLAVTFPMADRLWLSGSSAGGFGAVINWQKFQNTFVNTRVDLLNDAGQPVDANPGQVATWKRAWNMQVPADCMECSTSLAAVMGYYHNLMMARGNRSALLGTLQDQTLRGFFLTTANNFEAATRRLLTTQYDGRPNAHYWIMAGSMHTFITGWRTFQDPNGVFLRDWLTQFATDDPMWRNSGPPAM